MTERRAERNTGRLSTDDLRMPGKALGEKRLKGIME